MQTDNKKIIKNIMKKKDLEENLSKYASLYVNEAFAFSLIHFVLNYYTIKEVEEDTGAIHGDAFLNSVMEDVHAFVEASILRQDVEWNHEEGILKLHDIRNRMTEKMTILTAYTDALQLYEYILNRVEYGITGESYEVEPLSLATRIFQYLFNDQDKMVINSKIQMVTSQLPIRMTKSKFYEYLTETLNIYNGSQRLVLDEFIALLKSTALIEKPKGYGEEYKKIADFIQTLEELDYKNLSIQEYQMIQEQFSLTTQSLTELISNYLLVMELVNDLYTILLLLPYEDSEEESVEVCKEIGKGIFDSYRKQETIPEAVTDLFVRIEGVQEALGENIVQYEAVLQDVTGDNASLIESLMLGKIFTALRFSSKLMSNSLFVDLEDNELDTTVADSDYIARCRDELVEQLGTFFKEHKKEMNRAVMAQLFAAMPVLFNSQEEIKNHIENSLTNCNNDSELKACAKIIEDLMAED